MYNLGDFIHSCDISNLLTPLIHQSRAMYKGLDFRPKPTMRSGPPLWIGHNHLKLNAARLEILFIFPLLLSKSSPQQLLLSGWYLQGSQLLRQEIS